MAYHDMRQVVRRIKDAYSRAEQPLEHFISILIEYCSNLKHEHFGKEEELVPPPPFYNPQTYLKEGRIAGWFRCQKCGTENTLYYRKGDYPFGYLVCINPLGCAQEPGWGTVITSDTEISDVVQRHPFTCSDPVPVHPRIPNKLHNQIPFFVVCPKCGLSHRAVKSKYGLTWKQRLMYKLNDSRTTIPISYENIERCRHCGIRRRDSGKGKWLRFGIYYALGYHTPVVDNFNGYYGEPKVPSKSSS